MQKESKELRKDVQENIFKIIKAVIQLQKEDKEITRNSIAEKTELKWVTVDRYFQNEFYLKGKEYEIRQIS